MVAVNASGPDNQAASAPWAEVEPTLASFHPFGPQQTTEAGSLPATLDAGAAAHGEEGGGDVHRVAGSTDAAITLPEMQQVVSSHVVAIDCKLQPSLGSGGQTLGQNADSGSSGLIPSCKASDSAKRTRPAIGKAEGHVLKMLTRLRAAHLAGHRNTADHLTVEFLRSFDARYVAVARACKQMKKNRRPKPDLWPGIAKKLDAWQGTDEEVIARFTEKKNSPNQFRTILAFGIENRALQYLVNSVLEARAELHPSQYLVQGGFHKAVQKAAELVAGGHEWAVETDIRNCYASFEGEKVINHLPLPKKVTLHSLLGVSLNLKAYPSHSLGSAELDEYVFDQELADVRRGFPQGSAASPLAVEILLARLYAQLPAASVSVGYADNFLALAKQEEDAVSTTTAFWSALNAHPAGQLEPKEPKTFEPGKPIEFLGHTLQLQQGKVRIDPATQNLAEFEARLNAGLQQIRKATKDSPGAARRAKKLRRYVMSWTGAFKLCNGMGICRSRALWLIEQASKGYQIKKVTYSDVAAGTT